MSLPVNTSALMVNDNSVEAINKALNDLAGKIAATSTAVNDIPTGFTANTNLSSATADYTPQVGETCQIDFTSATSVPLHIATGDGTEYLISISPTTDLTTNAFNGSHFLNPNNTTYGATDFRTDIWWVTGGTGGGSQSNNTSALIASNSSFITLHIFNRTISKAILGRVVGRIAAGSERSGFMDTRWDDNSTVWSSLGTIVFPTSCSGTILVKRIL